MALSVGFIGVGNMGNPMAGNVLKNFPLTVFDKSQQAMANLVQGGAKQAASAKDVADRCEIVMTCLPASPDVEALYLEPGGLVDCAKPGTVLIDLSSVLPSTPRKIEPVAKKRGVHFLEAPVSGGTSGAKAATLAVMVGGDAAVLKRVEPVLKSLGPNIFHVGTVGAGNTVKAINNMMACVNSLAMMQGLTLGLKAGPEVIGPRLGVIAVVAVVMLTAGPRSWAGSPTDDLRGYVDRAITVLEAPDMKGPGHSVERHHAVRSIAGEGLDFLEASRRALGRHWEARTPDERARFVALFTALIDTAYLSK